MARLFKAKPLAPAAILAAVRTAIGSDLALDRVADRLENSADLSSWPFILYSDHSFPRLPNAFIRSRHDASIFDAQPLAPSSLWDYARDLASFLSLYSDPHDEDLTDAVFTHYLQHLGTLRTELSDSTIERRAFVARAFRSFIAEQSSTPTQARPKGERCGRTFINFANTRVTAAGVGHGSPWPGRRRNPGLLHVLPPEELRRFFASFEDRTLRAAAMAIYSTGGRRMDVCQLTAGAAAAMRPAYPGGPAFIEVLSKSGKRRQLEIEAALQKGLRSFLVSPHRLKRAKLYAARHGVAPLGDTAPLFINRFGDALSKDAVTDAFRRASRRSGIVRTPHELRHEFAVNYLLNAYRGLERVVQRTGFDRWLGQLLDGDENIVVVRLSRLLGHADPGFTKKTYLVMLAEADPAIRDAWCEHLSSINLEGL